MSKFIYHTGIVLPLNIANIDTDNIIPKQFLQETTRSNFGKYLFFNWRYIKHTETSNPNFIMNHVSYKNASILLSRKNFGCGSSREHAVWALIDYGFKVIIAPSFADIFYKNSFINQLLLITLSELEINNLFQEINIQKKSALFTVNLTEQKIYTKNKYYPFKIDNFYKNYMTHDLDPISVTLNNEDIIQKYESNQPPFLY